MSVRSAHFRFTDGVKSSVSQGMITTLVERAVDTAYEKNITIGSGIYARRFQVLTVNGFEALGQEILDAWRDNPESVGTLFVIVALTEEKGEDHAHVLLQSELEKLPNLPDELRRLVDSPPLVDVKEIMEKSFPILKKYS